MSLFDLFGSGNEAAARDAANRGLRKGYDQASGMYGQGRDALTTNFNLAAQPFQTLMEGSAAGAGAYADASGAGGAEGLARAGELFRQVPGYAGGLTTGLDAIDRRAASRGMLGSGNTNLDTIRFASDYDAGRYGNYMAGLAPYLDQQRSAAQGLATVNMGLGTGLDQSFRNQGQLGYNTQAGIGNNNAAFEMSKNQTGLNQLGALFGGANLGMKAFGLGMFDGLG